MTQAPLPPLPPSLEGLPALAAPRREALLARAPAPFARLLGLRVTELDAGAARLHLPFRREITHEGGIVQGGLITTLADSAIAWALNGALAARGEWEAGVRHTTIEMKINLMRPVPAGDLHADGWLIHLGRSTAVGEALVRNAEGRTVAKCLATFMLLPPGA